MPQALIEGEVMAPGVLCPRFRLADGEEISLETLPPGTSLTPGDRLRLTGSFLRASRCQQGRGFAVTAVAPQP